MRFIFILCCFLVVSIPPVSAASSDTEKVIPLRKLNGWRSSVKKFTEYYASVIKDLRKNPAEFDGKIRKLRSYYSYTSQYSPFAKNILDQMTEYAAIAMDSDDREAGHDALLSYNSLLNTHLVNFDVVSFALTMSRVDIRFGDEEYYKSIRSALIKSFVLEHKGTTPESAYGIISYGEGTYILEKLGGTVKTSEVFEVGKMYYNVHSVVKANGERVQVYMNVTEPIRNVMYNQAIREKEAANSIPLQ